MTRPEVEPDRPMVPVEVPARPMTGVTVSEGTPVAEAFRIPPLTVARPVIMLSAEE